MRKSIIPLLIIVAFLQPSFAYVGYQTAIPNGQNVKDGNGNPWPGVGHERPGGGGARNSFGADFAAAGHKWTKELCATDSDGDGYTNGEELGDPECVWQEGDVPQFTTYITNPGDNGDRTARIDTCANHSALAGTVSSNFTFDSYQVLAQDTTYVKQAFPVEQSGEQLVTRISPVIDQHEIVHHMLLYACTEAQVDGYLTPNPEGGMPCSELVFAWAVGGSDFCMPEGVALVIDAEAFPYVMLEIHYDNPSKSSQFTDSSGLKLDLVPKASYPEVVEAGFFWVGIPLQDIRIPPNQEHYHLQGGCTIPNGLPEEGVQVVANVLHAHKLGRKMYTTIEREGQSEVSSCDPRYDFDLQEFIPPENPSFIKSGDKVSVNCVYDSRGVNGYTTGGDETSNEMCLQIVIYYPKLGPTGKCWVPKKDQLVVQGDPTSSSGCQAQTISENDFSSSSGVFGSLTTGFVVHGILMLVSWAIVFPIGTMFPLMFKSRGAMESHWFNSHRATMAVGLLMTLCAAVIAFVNSGTLHLVSLHGKLGVVTVALAVQQPLLALCRPTKQDDQEQSIARRSWEVAHHSLGRNVVILGNVTIYLGLTSNVATAEAIAVSYVTLSLTGFWVLLSIGLRVAKKKKVSTGKEIV